MGVIGVVSVGAVASVVSLVNTAGVDSISVGVSVVSLSTESTGITRLKRQRVPKYVETFPYATNHYHLMENIKSTYPSVEMTQNSSVKITFIVTHGILIVVYVEYTIFLYIQMSDVALLKKKTSCYSLPNWVKINLN